MTLVGKKAPDFELEGVLNNEVKPFKLSQFKGGWTVILFYPRSFTGVCQSEIKGFADEFEKFKKKGVHLLAVSTDSPFVHQAWIAKDIPNMKFPVLADVTHQVAKMYDVLADNGAALRATFIINPEGLVVHESVNFFHVGRSTAEAERLLSAFQSGGWCDLNWKPK
ncbi:MAG: peroxiredoxin [Candidatus Bilamarchaeum sp.]|jgi:alkyl hydroperoxide reductase subunit AhpC